MKRKDWMIVVAVLIGMVAVFFLFPQRRVQYDNMDDAWASVTRLNYSCCSDVRDGHFINGFMVSKEVATYVDAGALHKTGPMGPQWRNKVWVMPLRPGILCVPDDAATRIWGRVFVFGDSAFLDEIESGLLRQSGSA